MKEKIKTIWRMSVIWMLAWIRGKADKKISDPKKVLVIQMAKLGDMVCTTPMFRAIKKNYPGCGIVVLGNAINKELLADNRDVDEYLVVGKDFKSEVKKIRRGSFEAVFLTSPNLFHLMAAYRAGVSLIVTMWVEGGFSPLMTRSYKWLAPRLAVLKLYRMEQYAPREYLRLLETIGIRETETKKYLAFTEGAKKKAGELLGREENIVRVGVAVTAGNKIKEWTRKNFAGLIDYLTGREMAVILFGTTQDREAVDEVLSYIKNANKLIDLTGRINIDELKAVVARLDLFISADTGPIYIAEAFQVPTVDIVGPVDEKEQPLIGLRNLIVVAKRKRPELKVMNARFYNEEEARRQVEEIKLEKVINKFEELLKVLR